MIQILRNKAYRTLRWSEQYFKTDMIYLTKGGFWLSFNQISGFLVSFLMAIAFANLLSQDSYGYYKYIISIAGVLGAFSLTGLNIAIVRSVSLGKEYLAKYSEKISLKWSLPMMALGAMGSLYYWVSNNYTLSFGLFLITLFQPVIQSSSFYSPFLNGRKNFRELAKLQIIRNVFPALFLLLSLTLTNSVIIIVSVYFFSHSTTSFILNRYVFIKFKPNELSDDVSYGYAKKLSLINLLTLLGMRADSLLIFHYIGAGPLAIYTFASAVPDQIMGFMKNVYTLSLPKFSATNTETLKKTLVRKTLIFALASGLLAAIYSFVSYFLFQVFFPQYLEAVPFTRVISINIILAAIGMFPAVYFDAQAEARKKTIITTTSNVSKIILMFLLIQVMGIWGIILAELLSRSIAIVVMFFLIFKK